MEYEEQLERIGLSKGDSVKQSYMVSLLQLVQNMNKRGMFPQLLLGHHILPQCLLGIQMRTTFSPKPSCLAVGVTSMNKITKKVFVRLRRVPKINLWQAAQN